MNSTFVPFRKEGVRPGTLTLTLWLSLSTMTQAAGNFEMTLRDRQKAPASGLDYVVKETRESWNPKQTAVIVCDMWDLHHCKNAVTRVGEMAPRMNDVLIKARDAGALIIHAPSSCMDFYKGHPGRLKAASAPKAANLPEQIESWCYIIPSEEQGVYPIDQSDLLIRRSDPIRW